MTQITIGIHITGQILVYESCMLQHNREMHSIISSLLWVMLLRPIYKAKGYFVKGTYPHYIFVSHKKALRPNCRQYQIGIHWTADRLILPGIPLNELASFVKQDLCLCKGPVLPCLRVPYVWESKWLSTKLMFSLFRDNVLWELWSPSFTYDVVSYQERIRRC
jgi:hypothetical protein